MRDAQGHLRCLVQTDRRLCPRRYAGALLCRPRLAIRRKPGFRSGQRLQRHHPAPRRPQPEIQRSARRRDSRPRDQGGDRQRHRQRCQCGQHLRFLQFGHDYARWSGGRGKSFGTAPGCARVGSGRPSHSSRHRRRLPRPFRRFRRWRRGARGGCPRQAFGRIHNRPGRSLSSHAKRRVRRHRHRGPAESRGARQHRAAPPGRRRAHRIIWQGRTPCAAVRCQHQRWAHLDRGRAAGGRFTGFDFRALCHDNRRARRRSQTFGRGGKSARSRRSAPHSSSQAHPSRRFLPKPSRAKRSTPSASRCCSSATAPRPATRRPCRACWQR